MILFGILLELFGLIKLLVYLNNTNDFIQTCKTYNPDYGMVIFIIVLLDALLGIVGGAYILSHNVGL